MLLLRSLLFVPGIVPRMIEKAPTTGADLLCLDLEDSVPPKDKVVARGIVADSIPSLAKGNSLLFVRVNSLETGLLEDDLSALVSDALDGISLPKADSPDVVRQVDSYLTILEKQRGLPVGKTRILPWIESAKAVLNAVDICKSSPRLLGASFGAEDFSNDMQMERTRDSREVEWARYFVATACRAAQILPIDTPELNFGDLDHLEKMAQFAKGIGYRGKYCIHPTQIDIVNRVFSPSLGDVARARLVVSAYESGEKQGRGAVALDGMVVDWPIYTRAKALLEEAEEVHPAIIKEV